MRNVLEWLEESSREKPQATAFADESTCVSFAELACRAQSIGSFIAQCVNPCVPVALFCEKSTLALSGMLGATYARCPYSVFDVWQPATRLASIVETLQPGIVLTAPAYAQKAQEAFAEMDVRVVDITDIMDTPINEALLAQRRDTALDVDPLYINFTSGSTGVPKGVAVSHRSVIDFIPHFTRIFGITGSDRIANQAPFDFDVSVKDIYSGLFTGAEVHLIPREYFSIPVKLMDFLADRELTVCTWAVSAMCFVSIMSGFDYRVPTSISKVIFSGEVMPIKQLNVWRKHLPHALFANVYGPTEITCNCTYYIIDREFERNDVIPMGKPFPNEKVFLLDEENREVLAEGIQGEICVGGTALALGYYNNPERTAESFVQNPLHNCYLDPIYRTGDMGIWNAEGDLVYVSRKDHQIKHMGQRIELGEIDVAAQSVEGVEQACCLYDARKKRILLFFAGDVTKETVSAKLHDILPAYMVPNKVFPLERMPLTKNGKVDRAELAQLGGVK